MKISAIILCKNEERMLPWTLRYYSQYVDEIYVYDNASTDSSREKIAQYKIAKLIPYDTGGVLRDDIHAMIKSKFYRCLNSDWYIIVDMDEYIWHPDGLRNYLESCTQRGITFPNLTGWQMIGDGWPEDDGKSQLTDHIKYGVRDEHPIAGTLGQPVYDKKCVIHKSIEIEYGPGAHGYGVSGKIVTIGDEGLKLLHYKWVDKNYTLERIKLTETTLPINDKSRAFPSFKYWVSDAKRIDDIGVFYDKAKKNRILLVSDFKDKDITINMRSHENGLIAGLKELINDIPYGLSMVEVGCYAGESTGIFASKVSKVFAVDPWIDFIETDGFDPNHKIKMCMDGDGVENRFNKVMEEFPNIIKLKGKSADIAVNFPDGSVDFVYIDADHVKTDEDIKLWLPKIKPFGLIGGHDYNRADVSKAVNEILGAPHKIYRDSSWAKRLPGDKEYDFIIANIQPSIKVSNSKIRILEFHYLLINSGAHINSQTLMSHYDRTKFEVFLAARSGGEAQQKMMNFAIKNNIKLFIEPDQDRMVEWIRNKEIDVAHYYRVGTPDDAIAINTFLMAKVPIIVEHNCFGSFDQNRNKVHKQIMCSKSSLDGYKRLAGSLFDPQKATYEYLPTETEFIADYCKNRDYNRPIFGRHSRKDMAKWHPINIQSLPLIRKAIPDAKFYVIGIPDEYVYLARQFGVMDMIEIFQSPMDDLGIYDFLNKITVFAHSAWLGESFGNSIAEAMSSGLPIVTHSINPQIGENAQCEIVTDSYNGYITNLSDDPVQVDISLASDNKVMSYANGIISLLSNPQLKIKMGNNSKKFAQKWFDAEKVTRRIENIYVEEYDKVRRSIAHK